MQYGGLAVYTGNAHPNFARDICRTLEIPLGSMDVFKFANDNIFVKINDNVREHDVYVVQSLCMGVSGSGIGVSDSIMELLIMIDAFKRASAARITAILDVPLVFMQKTHRDNSGRSEIVGVIGDIDRRKAIILDDEIDRGTTMLNTIRVLQEHGVGEIWVACTHAVLSGDAAERLLASGIVELVTTDTCPLRPVVRNDPRIRVLSVAPLFAEAIRRIDEGESVGALFNPPGLQLPLQVT